MPTKERRFHVVGGTSHGDVPLPREAVPVTSEEALVRFMRENDMAKLLTVVIVGLTPENTVVYGTDAMTAEEAIGLLTRAQIGISDAAIGSHLPCGVPGGDNDAS